MTNSIPWPTQRAIREGMSFSAVVDINGVHNPKTGGFHTLQDAHDANHQSIFVRNGTYQEGTITISKSDVTIVGESWDVVFTKTGSGHLFLISGDRFDISNIQAYTPAGGGQSSRPFNITSGYQSRVRRCYIPQSDDIGMYWGSNASHRGLIMNNWFDACDSYPIYCDTQQMFIGFNHFKDAPGYAIYMESNSEDCVIVGNICPGAGTAGLHIQANAEDTVAVANRFDGAVSDSSGTSTVASNDETAF